MGVTLAEGCEGAASALRAATVEGVTSVWFTSAASASFPVLTAQRSTPQVLAGGGSCVTGGVPSVEVLVGALVVCR